MPWVAGSARADPIYLCHSYSAGMFWSSANCRSKDALIDRIETVPSGMPFAQQVAIAESQRGAAQALYPKAPVAPRVTRPAQLAQQQPPPYQTVCQALDEHIKQLDALARQPLSGQAQDWISAERKRDRDEQFRLRCR